ncbi:UDP-N-acetylmuramoyl-L-alanyl-D-glutamate--2,6-diaminopimelate ligase, partial [Streptomonospora algeriensis]
MRPEQTQPRPLSELARLLGPDAFVTCVETAEDSGAGGGAEPAADPGATAISGITHDSRAVRPGDL